MALTPQDKACKVNEKGWIFIYELAIYDQIRQVNAIPLQDNYWLYIFDDFPRTVKTRISLNDTDKSHKWQLGGTTTGPSNDTVHSQFVYRQIFYPGGTPVTAFRETGFTFTPSSPQAYQGNGYSFPAYTAAADSELLDYRFIFCPQEDETEWEVGDCSCPDKTKQQPANQDSPNPSEWSDRSWVDSNAGARGYCKHEYASYKYVGKPQPQPPLPESEV